MNVRRNAEAGAPCQRCFALWDGGHIDAEMVQPLPSCPSIGLNRERQCSDCQAAETLLKLGMVATVDLKAFVNGDEKAADDYESGFQMARICVGNDRMEQYRLPGVPMGLVKMGLVRPNAPGDFDAHLKWMDVHIPGWMTRREDP